MTRRARFLIPGILLALVLAWRIAYLAESSGDPLFHHPIADAQVYDELARGYAEGQGYPLPVFANNPFYPYLLGFFYRLFGPGATPIAVFQILLGVVGVWLLYRIASRLGGRSAGVLAILIGGFYRPTLFYETFRIPTAIGLVLNLLLLDRLLAYRPGGTRGVLFLSGLLLGLGTLIQGNLVLLLPFLLVWIVLAEKGRGRAAAAGILLAGTALAILPVTLRNAVRGGDFVLVSSHGGVNFFMGNNENARGGFTFPEAIVLTPENINIHESRRLAEKATGRPMKPSEISGYWLRRGLDWIAGHPGDYLRLLGRKAVLFWNDVELPDNADPYFFETRNGALRRTPFVFGVAAPLGLFGVFLLIRRRKGTPVLLFLLAQFVSALLFYIHSRYRIPFAGVFLAPAAIGLVRLAREVRRRRWPRLIWSVAILALLLVLVNRTVTGSGRSLARASSITHLGQALEKMGRTGEAHDAYEEALRILPGHATALYNSARLAQSEGDLGDAERRYRAAIRAVPSFAEAYLNLGTVYRELNRNEQAVVEYREAIRLRPDWAEAHYNLGNALFDLERYGEAEEAYRAASAIDPENRDAARCRVNAREKAGDLAGAEGLVREELARRGEDADLRNRLGDLLEKRGREEEALAEYRRAVELNPRHSAAHCNIGLVYFHRGENEEAIRAWKRILAYDPDSPIRENIRLAEDAMRSGRGEGEK